MSYNGGYFTFLQVFNNGIGYAYDNNYNLVKSTDFGNSWNYLCNIGTGSYSYINSDTVVKASGRNLYKSVDGGYSWYSIPFYTLSSFAGFVKIIYFDRNNVIATISYGSQFPYSVYTCIGISSDGGYNWSDYCNTNGIGGNTLQVFTQDNIYFSVLNKFFYSTNGGINWQNNTICDNNISNIAVIKNNLWISGGNSILKGTGLVPVIIKDCNSIIPNIFSLSQNYPNPFNPSTTIKFQIKDSRFVTLKVYDILGKEIATLVNEKLKAGEYETTFDGSAFPSGVYFCKLQAGVYSETKKMLMIK